MNAAPISAIPFLRPAAPFRVEELDVMVRDGLVRRVIRDVHVAATLPDTVALRALAIDLLLEPAYRRRAAVCRATAVWLYHGGPPPAVLDVLVDARHRAGRASAGVRVHETVCADTDAVVVAGVLVTTAPQTALDLAQFGSAEDTDALRTVLTLLTERDRALLRDRLVALPRRPGRGLAVERLRDLMPAS